MKLSKCNLVLCLLTAGLFSLFYSCEKQEIEKPSVPSFRVGQVNIPSLNQSQFPEDINSQNTNIFAETGPKELQQVVQQLTTEFEYRPSEQEPLMGIVLYTSGSVEAIDFKELKGFSTIVVKDNNYFHRLHKLENGSLIIPTEFSVECNYFYMKELSSLKNTLFGNATSWLYLNNLNQPFAAEIATHPRTHQFSKAIRKIIKDDNQARPNQGGGTDPCADCGGGGDEHSGCGYSCGNYECMGECDKDECEDIGMAYNQITENDILPNDLGYSFRDEFLSNYNIGNDYIGYYYTVSEATNLLDYITVSNFWDYYNVLLGLHETAAILQFGDDMDIPINTTLFENVIFIINDMKNAPVTPPSVVDILNIVEADFIQYHGQTRLEILNAIN